MRNFFSSSPVGGPGIIPDSSVTPADVLYGVGQPSGELDFRSRLRRARLGLFVGSTGILMIFISLTSAYVVRQGLPTFDPQTNTLVRDWFPLKLPGLLFINTLVLILSSGTMELARRQFSRRAGLAQASTGRRETIGREDGLPWLGLTVLLGLSFLIGQWTVWSELAARGFYISTNPSSSFFYLLTGTHGVHLLGGILALLVASAATLLRRPGESQAIIVDVAGWYWHFMAVLWVYILCLLEFAR